MHANPCGSVALVPCRGDLYRIGPTSIHRVYDRVSEFLRYCAACINEGAAIDRGYAPPGWVEWVCLTLPLDDDWDKEAIVETRVLRFLLAADIAESEGH